MTSRNCSPVWTSWQVVGAIVAMYAPRGGEGLDVRLDGPPPEAGELLQRVADSGDAHVIKLTEAALREHRRTGDVALLHAAHAMADRWP